MAILKDETGNKYGRWTVLYKAYSSKKGVYWHCRCECGNEKDVFGGFLRRGISQSCGCLKHEKIVETNIKRGRQLKEGEKIDALTIIKIEPKNILCKCECGNEKWMSRSTLLDKRTKYHTCGCRINQRCATYIDETGNKYGKLTVIEEAGLTEEKRVLWRCRCDCGNEKIALSKSLRAGLVQSCGCLKSVGEQKINQILTDLEINFTTQQTFKDLFSNKGWHLYFDFYLPDYNILIEYQGIQHYECTNRLWNNEENFQKTQEKDNIKRQYCERKNIKLIEVPYTDLKEINQEYILNLIGGKNEDTNY